MSNVNRHRHSAATAEKVQKPFYKNWLTWIGLAPVLIFAIFLGYEFIVQEPKAKRAQAELEVEFSSIVALPEALTVSHSASHKTSQALVDATYITSANPADIFKHYDEALKKQGWQPYGVSGTRDWGRDLGGESAYYCKGDYSAQLQYTGQQANYGWTYAFSASWGLGDCRTEAQGGRVKQTVPASLFMIGFGSFFAVLAGYYTRNAWTKSADEYLQWLRQQRKSKWANFWLSAMPKSYPVWNDRIGSILGIAIGSFMALVGAYSLWRNIFGG